MPSREDEFYEQAAKEVATKEFVPGIWAKAFSQSPGNDQHTIALYIKLRVKQLKQDGMRSAVNAAANSEAGKLVVLFVALAALLAAISGVMFVVMFGLGALTDFIVRLLK